MNSTYLKKLGYRPEYSKGFVANYLTNIRFVALLLIAVIPLGIFSFLNLQRRLNPEVNLPFVSVITTLPGASPNEIESLVTIPLEEAINDIPGIDTLNSDSRDSVSAITIQFNSSEDVDTATEKVQRAVDKVINLPEDANEPRVEAFDIEDEPILRFSISTEGDSASLVEFAKTLKDSLISLPKIRDVEITGFTEQEISVSIDVDKTYSYGINPIALSNQIKSGLTQIPVGTLSTDKLNIPLSIDKKISSINDIRNLTIKYDGGSTTLSEIATVTLTPAPDQTQSYIVQNGKVTDSVNFSVFKTKQADIVEAGSEAEKLVNDQIANFGGEFNYFETSNNANEISNQFNTLGSNFAQTLALVFITLFIFLGLRQSLIVALSIPISFLISFTVMSFAGLSLNFLSVFSLLLALGLLVDDAIVIVSAFTNYYKSKKFTAHETGILVWKDFIIPIWSTTITTVWAFVPLLLATGIIGEFIKTIPIVVSSTLIASTSVAVLITLPITMQLFELKIPNRLRVSLNVFMLALLYVPYLVFAPKTPFYFIAGLITYTLLLSVLLINRKRIMTKTSPYFKIIVRKRVKKITENGFIDTSNLVSRYKSVINNIIGHKAYRRKVVLYVSLLSIFSYLLLPAGFVINEFFPKVEGDSISLTLRLPEGSKAEQTRQQALSIAERVSGNPSVSQVALDIESGGTENIANLSIRLKDKDERKENSIQLSDSIRKIFSDYSEGEISVFEPAAGPPVGDDISLTILGEDLPQLSQISETIEEFLKNSPGVINVESSLVPAGSKIGFQTDAFKLANAGIGANELGLWLRTFTSGYSLGTFKDNNKDYDIKFRMGASRFSPENLGMVKIPSQSGYVPLENLGEFKLSPNPSLITREGGKRSVTVTASVESGYSTSEINSKLNNFTGSMKLPDGYSFKTGGVNEENQRSITSILQAMLIATLLILTTMVIQLGSFRKSVIVLLVIPLAVSGVFLMFALTKTPLSFPALIGVLALFGIVVNNSIMIVEKINQNLALKIEFKEAISDAASSRVEPILFTSLTTIFGLLPITLTDPLWRGLGGAIIAGLSISGVIMLFFIPTIYYMWFKPANSKY